MGAVFQFPAIASSESLLPRVGRVKQDRLKILALASMVLDHFNKIILQGEYPAFSVLGRLAFPLFAFLLAYNLIYRTRRPWVFIARLAGWAVVSQLFYMYAFGTYRWNIFFTLTLGTVGAHVFRSGDARVVGTALALVLWGMSRFISPLLSDLEFGLEGVVLILLWGHFLERPTIARFVWLVAVVATLNSSEAFFPSLFYGAAALSSLIAIYSPNPLRVSATARPRFGWFFYFFYPAHLFALRFTLGS